MYAQRPAHLLLPRSSPPSKNGKKREPRPTGGENASRSAPQQESLSDADDQALFEALRAHRLRLAKAQSVPPYVVASDRTLREIAAARPASQAELLQIHGIGPAKAQQYGAGLLEVVTNWAGASEVNDPASPEPVAEAPRS